MKKTRFYMAAMAITLALTWACNSDDGPTTPTAPTPPVVGGAPITPPTTSPPLEPSPGPDDPPADTNFGFDGGIRRYNGKTISGWVRNASGNTEPVGFACYEAPNGVNELANQVLADHVVEDLDANRSVTFVIEAPACRFQCDLFVFLRKPLTPPFYTGRQLVAFVDSDQMGLSLPDVCPEPVCEVNCGEPKCDVPALEVELELRRQACLQEEGFFTGSINPVACSVTSSCDTEPVCNPEKLKARAEAACEFGVESLDFEKCSWTCKPEPPCDEDELKQRAKKAATAACEHGVESISLDVKACDFEFTCKPPPEECVLPNPGFVGVLKPGNSDRECSQVGNYQGAGKDEHGPPWNVNGDFYLVKCGTEYEIQLSRPTGSTCQTIRKDISHVSACECSEDDDSSDDDSSDN